MKKNTRWKIMLGVLLVYLFVVDPVIEHNQTIFPTKAYEMERVALYIGEETDDTGTTAKYFGMNNEQKRAFVDAMNAIVLQSGEQAKDSIAYEIIKDAKIDRREQPPIAEIRIEYKKNLLQRKAGLDLCFYEDQSFLIQEWSRITMIPFTMNRVSSKPQVYEHGFEIFVDGSENQQSVEAVLALLEEYRLWHAEHQ